MFERAGKDLQELVYLNALRLVNGLGAVKIARLVDFFGSAERAWFATGIELGACLGPDKAVEAII
ncbi:MAG TPA: hypothetical protein VNU93_07920, partial [Verrucomicrobiae bacterium]|nr:hypothetical protein [Verrucomicrobiae bacterium]